jgi:hypothetical protein
MFFSAATESGVRNSPNEDWLAISPTTVIVLDGVTVFKEVKTGCMHGTPWYVNQLGTRFLAAALDQDIPLRYALRTAISGVAGLHADVCELDQIGAPSAAVGAIRKAGQFIEHLVLADVTIVINSIHGLTVVSDERVSCAVGDLAEQNTSNAEVMKRRERYRNKRGGYWVAAADPDVVEHAKTGRLSLDGFRCAAIMSDGVSRLVSPFEQTDWPGVLSLVENVGPAALIDRIRHVESSDMERTRWPRFKVSDDATIAFIRAQAQTEEFNSNSQGVTYVDCGDQYG